MTQRTRSAAEHARTKAALLASEARLRQALDTADMGTWSWDLATGQGILDARGAALVGLDGGVVPDQPFDVAAMQRKSIHPDDLASVEAAVAEGLTTGTPFVLRYRTVAPDGRLRHILSNVRVESNIDGRPVRLSGTNRDVTSERDAEAALRQLNEDLERRVRARTTELNELFARLTSAQEEERRRIARDIHDQLGQQMTALRMSIEAWHMLTSQDEALTDHIQRTAALAEEVDQTIDFLTAELRPTALDVLGLSATLAELTSGWSERFGIKSEFDAVGVKGMRLPAAAEINLYRVVQEALHNVYKHAQATHVNVRLEKRGQRLLVAVEDNGVGFTQVTPLRIDSGSLGLIHMRERAMLAGGELTIESTPARGTTVVVSVPI